MPTSELFEAGDVVIVPFPFTDRLAEKRRPALVVSAASLHEGGMLWVVMITAAKLSSMNADFAISDPVSAGLTAACFVRPAKIASLEAGQVIRKAGRLARADTLLAFSGVRGFIGAAPAGNGGRGR